MKRTRGVIDLRALVLVLPLMSACSIAVPIPAPDPAPELEPAPKPLGPVSVYFAPDVRAFTLNDPGPPPFSTRTYRAALGPALIAPIKEACAPLFTELGAVSSRQLREGDRWLLSFDNLVVKARSGENEPCRVRIFLQYAISDGKGRLFLEGLLDASGEGTEHQGVLRYSESLGNAISRSVEKLCRDLRKTLAARRRTFEDQKPESAKGSSG